MPCRKKRNHNPCVTNWMLGGGIRLPKILRSVTKTADRELYRSETQLSLERKRLGATTQEKEQDERTRQMCWGHYRGVVGLYTRGGPGSLSVRREHRRRSSGGKRGKLTILEKSERSYQVEEVIKRSGSGRRRRVQTTRETAL